MSIKLEKLSSDYPQSCMRFFGLYQYFNDQTPIPFDEWVKIERNFYLRDFKRGDVLQRSGELPDSFFVVIKGLAKSYFINEEGREFIKRFFAENEIASAYTEFLQNVPSRITIQAMEDMTVACFPFKKLEKLYLDHHSCWNRLGRIITENFFILKEQREYEFLTYSAFERYQSFLSHYSHLKDRIPYNQLALYLGITPVSLSRILSRF